VEDAAGTRFILDEVTCGTYLRAKQEFTAAIDALNWLTNRNTEPPNLEQP